MSLRVTACPGDRLVPFLKTGSHRTGEEVTKHALCTWPGRRKRLITVCIKQPHCIKGWHPGRLMAGISPESKEDQITAPPASRTLGGEGAAPSPSSAHVLSPVSPPKEAIHILFPNAISATKRAMCFISARGSSSRFTAVGGFQT